VLPTDAAVALAEVPLLLATDVEAAAASAAAFSDIGEVIVVLTAKSPKKESGSFLKKRTKKLLVLCTRASWTRHTSIDAGAGAKVFCFFFSKKKAFLTL